MRLKTQIVDQAEEMGGPTRHPAGSLGGYIAHCHRELCLTWRLDTCVCGTYSSALEGDNSVDAGTAE